MDIKVGEYIRTAEGLIRKVDQIGEITIWLEDNTSIGLNERNIKHNFNIMDLIEAGDYVNGERIQFITNKTKFITDGGYDLLKKYKGIKTIVTKEQFKAMEYEV